MTREEQVKWLRALMEEGTHLHGEARDMIAEDDWDNKEKSNESKNKDKNENAGQNHNS